MDHKQILSAGSFAVDFLSKSDPFHLLIATDDLNPRTFLNILCTRQNGFTGHSYDCFLFGFWSHSTFFFSKDKIH